MGGLFKTPTTSTTDTKINSMRIQQSAFGLCQPLVYGTTRITANLFWYGNFQSHAHTETTKTGGKGGGSKTRHTSYTYSASLMMGLAETVVLDIKRVWKDKEQLVDQVVEGVNQRPIDRLGFELNDGFNNRTWPYLETHFPSEALTYRYLGFVAAADYDMGNVAGLANHSFEVVSQFTFADTPDMNPADVLEDFIKHPRYGAAPDIQIYNLEEFRTYCAAANLLVSPAYVEQRDAHEIIEELVEAVNCAIVPSQGGITVKTYGDAPLQAHGYQFTPNLEPVYHLTDDDFIGDTVPVTITRSRDTDAFNHVQVEFFNRYNQYNSETIPASDQANIEMFGLRSDDVVNYSFICDPKIARHVAQLRLQRYLYVRNTYEFSLGWKYCLLEPMDIVSLSSEACDLDNVLVRIVRIAEDEDGLLSITAEELAIGSRSAIEYDLQSSNGYQGGSNAPGNVNAPVIFEPPLDQTNGSREAWIAVSGGVDWGGCNVWVSLDNTSYELIGTVYGSARYGTLQSGMTDNSSSMDIQLNTPGQLFSGSQVDADAGLTMCKVGDEYLSYETADLLAQGKYNLSGLVRGKFSERSVHSIGEQFVRMDKAIFKYPYGQNLSGKQIYFKFTSFNGLQEKEQSLDQVSAYSYLLKGGAPGGVRNLSLQAPFVGFSFRVRWLSVQGALGYMVSVLSDGVEARFVQSSIPEFIYTNEDSRVDGLGRNFTVRVAAATASGTSRYSELFVSNHIPAKLLNVYTTSTADSVSVTWNPSDEPDLQDYAVWISTNPNLQPNTVAPSWTGTATEVVFTNLQTTTVFYVWVAARDVWKPEPWNLSDRKQISTGS